jgi:DNA-binding MarR family transcriptional regulator
MNETSIERRKRLEKARLLRVARKMERLQRIQGEVTAESGDPFALELGAKLHRVAEKHGQWGSKNKRAVDPAIRRRFRNGFTPPRMWKSGEQKGLAILDKALLFMSTFRDKGLGFRDLHVMIMLTGDNGISIQEAADLSGLTYYAIRKCLTKLEVAGLVKLGRIERVGGQKPLVNIGITAIGAGVMRALNRFDPNKIGDYDRLVAMGKPNIPVDMRILQMKGILDDARQIQQDI